MDSILADEILSEWHERSPFEIVERDIPFELPATRKAIAIIGPRRAGKTFFLFDLISHGLNIKREDTIFMNLEDHRFVLPSVKDLEVLLNTFFGRYPEKLGSRTYLFLDEVQNVDGWESFVRSVMDRYDMTVFITGSSSKLLSREIATSLRGRSISYLVLPFSFGEYLKVKGVRISLSPSGKASTLQHLKEYLRFGGFPEVILETSEDVKRRALRQYIEVMLFRDIVERYDVVNVKVLKLLLGQMMASSANPFSMNRFYGFLRSQGIGIDKNSIYNYKEYLIDAFGFIELKRIDGSYRTIEQGVPKIYPVDTGYMTDFGLEMDVNFGRFMETCVAIELYRRTEREPGTQLNFWRENSEVDFVISRGGNAIQLIQVCYDIDHEATYQREIKGLLRASKELDCENLLIIDWEVERSDRIDDNTIRLVPLRSWLTSRTAKDHWT